MANDELEQWGVDLAAKLSVDGDTTVGIAIEAYAAVITAIRRFDDGTHYLLACHYFLHELEKNDVHEHIVDDLRHKLQRENVCS